MPARGERGPCERSGARKAEAHVDVPGPECEGQRAYFKMRNGDGGPEEEGRPQTPHMGGDERIGAFR